MGGKRYVFLDADGTIEEDGWFGDAGEERAHLRLDADRLAELDEAWIPVRTADGPGVLVWCNSD